MSEKEKDIETIIDEIEAENDVKIETGPETEDDVREAFEINKEDGPREALGAPLIKAAGDPEPADMTMIHKHVDNFLAKIAGETPIDENVRDSTEYWLNRIAEAGGGASVGVYPRIKKLWTNPAPTASFDPQNVEIDLSKYSHIMVIAKFTASIASYTQSPVFCGVSEQGRISGYGQSLIAFRSFTSATTGITFTASTTLPYTDFVAVTDNTYIIPVEIYGINF